VNLAHLKAFIALRWAIRKNQMTRSGTANKILYILFAVMIVTSAIGLVVGGFIVGLYAMPNLSFGSRLLIWDVFLFGFVITRLGGLMMDIQRSDPLSLDRFLHLPVSPRGVFLINYVSSLFDLTLQMFLVTAVAMFVGQAISQSPLALLGLPLIVAFLFATSALQYQFQGWLAVLMSNQRRRRNVIVFFTLGIVLLAQAPQLIHFIRPWEAEKTVPTEAPVASEKPSANSTPSTHPTPPVIEPKEQPDTPIKPAEVIQPKSQKTFTELEKVFSDRIGIGAWWVNAIIPLGWFALGASSVVDGNLWPLLLATLGFVLVGVWCLNRAYHTTLRSQRGELKTDEAKAVDLSTTPSKRKLIIDWNWPMVSGQVSAVASASLQCLLRAPEAKMILVVPIVVVIVFGAILMGTKLTMPMDARPMLGIGAFSFVLFTSLQVCGNMFGYDRSGFRAFVLSPVSRGDILLGRNLAFAPLFLSLGALCLVVVGIIYPMRWDHYFVMLFVSLAFFLLYCLCTNAMSIIAPIPMAPGAMQPSEIKLIPILLQFLFIFLYPLLLAIVLIPFWLELLAEAFMNSRGIPIAMVGSILMFFTSLLVYKFTIRKQGNWLLNKEKELLLVVTSKAE
jgi:ABC-2 type transport system permease protein